MKHAIPRQNCGFGPLPKSLLNGGRSNENESYFRVHDWSKEWIPGPHLRGILDMGRYSTSVYSPYLQRDIDLRDNGYATSPLQ
jgi:hypothetical protein